MFSTISNSAEAFLRETGIEQDLSHPNQPAEQLQSELLNAVQGGMVTTRRQSHGLPNDELRNGFEINTPRKTSKKRKGERSEATTAPQVPVKRRKTVFDHSDNDGQKPSAPSLPIASEDGSTVQVDSAASDDIEGYKVEKGSLEPGARRVTSKKRRGEAGKGDRDNTPAVTHSEQRASSHDIKGGADRSSHNRDDQLRVVKPDLTVPPAGESTGTTSTSTTPKAKHFRFGSEGPNANAINANKGQSHSLDALPASVVEQSEDSEAEDEAPEVITGSAGAKAAKARNKEADRAAERQRAVAKEKRRERNDFLRQQAQFSKRAKKTKIVETPEDDSGLDHTSDSPISPLEPAPSQARTITGRPLPALLPDDILAADPAVRPATPPLEQNPGTKPKPKKHIFVETEPKPPKDIKRGPVKVRVLEGGRQNLPPKVSKESRNIRESWLGGRRGRNGGAVTERRKVGLGFTRM